MTSKYDELPKRHPTGVQVAQVSIGEQVTSDSLNIKGSELVREPIGSNRAFRAQQPKIPLTIPVR
jgi:hypothetical protein